MENVELTPLEPDLLPPIANASKEGAPPPYPRNFQAVNNQENFNRPEHGLWCSPVTAWSADGAPTATAWTAWLANPGDVTGQPSKHDGTYSRITAAKPLPEAQIYLIDTEADLDRLVAAFPLPPDHLMYRSTPDWEAMASAGWDAVYVTDAGLTANADRHVIAEPSLHGWDCPSVLWLRPTYQLTSSDAEASAEQVPPLHG
ncbi:hypothetical protein AQF52_8097 [Streptomyces venezuelae]|nr:hypothetical protein AQF52_0005 [Streptomyces venezuelae]ALO13678.1 hypothetical protein AQF52_8097 [Streptomyces venezuelae]